MTAPAVTDTELDALAASWGSWCPSMTPEGDRVAFISDRRGVPSVWVQDVGDPTHTARELTFTDDPVLAVSWSADRAWLACAVALDGGVKQQVWVVRPDGTGARAIAGTRSVHAELGPWTRSGHRVVVTIPPVAPGDATYTYLADPATGELHPLATGALISVLDLSVEERLLLLRDGERGRHFCVGVDRLTDTNRVLTSRDAIGTTESAILRPAPAGRPGPLVAYLVTDVGLPRTQLVAVPLGPPGTVHDSRVLAAREDAELAEVDADDAGSTLLLAWNVAGRTELELFDTTSEARTPIQGFPGTVAADIVLSRDGRSAFLTVDAPQRPRTLWRLDIATGEWRAITAQAPVALEDPVVPTLEHFTAPDGLALSGWLYRAATPGPALVWLHGGPESQERPVFSPQHQAMAAAGITVFAPNIRGSSGFGREFVHADERDKRAGSFGDIAAAAAHLVGIGAADAARIAVGGRSYGGYATLAALAFSPGVFCAGIDVCGMSDLRTFYRDTEPWIAAAAYPKYGHPRRDRALLRDLSPLRSADRIEVPLLVVHGELDTNVPLGEARQIVAALRALGRPVEYLELAGEGHEYRRVASRRTYLRTLVDFAVRTLRPGE